MFLFFEVFFDYLLSPQHFTLFTTMATHLTQLSKDLQKLSGQLRKCLREAPEIAETLLEQYEDFHKTNSELRLHDTCTEVWKKYDSELKQLRQFSKEQV
jgi:hypothetical protein